MNGLKGVHEKRPLRASRWNGGSSDLSFEVEDDTFEIGLVEDGLVLGDAKEESGTAEVVDPPGDTFGVIVDEGQEAVGEEGVLATGDAEMVFDVGGGLLEVEGFEVVADGDALAEGLEGSEAEFVGQVRLAEEDEGEERSSVHVVVEEEAELIEELRGQEVGLVDDCIASDGIGQMPQLS